MSSGSCLRGVPCGIQPSPRAATRRSAGLPEPPIQIGGRGSCTGRGRCPTSANSSRSPACSGHSSVSATVIASMASSVAAPRSANGTRARRTRLRRDRRRRRGSRARSRAHRAWRTPSQSEADAGSRRRRRWSSRAYGSSARRGTRVSATGSNHWVLIISAGSRVDRDVVADGDVEEPGGVARLRDVRPCRRPSTLRAPTRPMSAPTALGPAVGSRRRGRPPERWKRSARVQPGQTTDCISLYACSPNTPPSRPTPLYFMPPNGALWLRWVVLIPTLPARRRLLTRKARLVSALNT